MPPPTVTGDPLTDRQRDIWGWMIRHQRLWGMPPSLRQVMAAFGIGSPNGMSSHMRALVRKGYVRKTPGAQNTAYAHRCYRAVVPGGEPVTATRDGDSVRLLAGGVELARLSPEEARRVAAELLAAAGQEG